MQHSRLAALIALMSCLGACGSLLGISDLPGLDGSVGAAADSGGSSGTSSGSASSGASSGASSSGSASSSSGSSGSSSGGADSGPAPEEAAVTLDAQVDATGATDAPAEVGDAPSNCVTDLSNIQGGDFHIDFDVLGTAAGGPLLEQRSTCDQYAVQWDIAETSSGNIFTYFYDGSGGPQLQSVATINDGAWHHVVVARVSLTLSITIDGQLDNSIANAVWSPPTLPLLQVGRSVCPTPFAGQIKNVCITRQAPEEAGLTLDAQVSSAADAQGDAANGCANDLSNIQGGDFHIDFDVVGTAAGGPLLEQRSTCGQYDVHWLIAETSSGNIITQFYDGSGGPQLQSVATISDGVWHHVVVARVALTFSITIDGQLDNSIANAAWSPPTLPLLQVGRSACTSPFAGQIMNVCITRQ